MLMHVPLFSNSSLPKDHTMSRTNTQPRWSLVGLKERLRRARSRRRRGAGKACLERLEDRCLLAAFVVTTIADEADGTADPGVGAGTSLREAITSANANGEADTITFDTAGVFATKETITLTLGELPITDAVSITGTGAANLTISGNNASRIFNISDSTAALIEVKIVALTLTGGFEGSGGAIGNAESLIMRDLLLTDNHANNGNFILNRGGGLFNTWLSNPDQLHALWEHSD